jgi:hypothetical protein
MTFAQPWALALFALFVPVVLLYLLKQRRRHVQVSSLLFWERILHDEHRVASFTRLRKVLSLLLQLLLITLLVLALARPLFAKEVLGARRIVILLDTSASMIASEGETTRFALAVAHARELVRGMAIGDSAMLVAFAERPAVLVPFTSSRRTLHDALDQVQPTHGGTNLAAVLALLDELPPVPHKTHVHLLTDAAYAPYNFAPPTETAFAVFQAGTARENIGITAFQARPLPDSPGDFEVYFEVLNAGDQAVRAPYELRAGTRLVDAGELILAPNARERRTIRQFSRQGGELSLRLAHADPLLLDNAAFAVLPPVRPITVALVTPGNLFLEQALATDPGIALEVLPPGAYDEAKIFADVVVFDAVAQPAPTQIPSLHIAAWPADFALAEQGVALDLPVTSWDRTHRVNRHLRLDSLVIREAVRVAPPENFDALAQSFDTALILCDATSDPHRLVFTFDTAASDLPLRAAFPMLLSNSIRFLAASDAMPPWTSVPTGTLVTKETVAACLRAGETVWHVLAPDEAALETPPPDSPTPLEAAALLADRVGVYRGVTLDGAQRPLFAANLANSDESRIAPTPRGPFAEPEKLSPIAQGVRLGLVPYYFLLALALFLLCVEWVLYHRRLLE